MKVPVSFYAHIGPHLGLIQANRLPTGAPGEKEFVCKETILEEIKRRVFNEYDSGESELDEAAQGALASLHQWIENLGNEKGNP